MDRSCEIKYAADYVNKKDKFQFLKLVFFQWQYTLIHFLI